MYYGIIFYRGAGRREAAGGLVRYSGSQWHPDACKIGVCQVIPRGYPLGHSHMHPAERSRAGKVQ